MDYNLPSSLFPLLTCVVFVCCLYVVCVLRVVCVLVVVVVLFLSFLFSPPLPSQMR